MKKIFLIALLLPLIFHNFAQKSFAQDVNVGVYPPVFQITATPPSDIRTNFFVQNLSDKDSVDLDIAVKPFTAGDRENGEVSYQQDLSTYEDPYIFEKMEILDGENSVSSITLAPKQKKNLVLHIQIPKEETSSDYYFSILFISKAGDNVQLNGSQATGAIASNVLLSIGQKGKTEGVISDFSAPFFVEKGPVPFTVRVKNTSSHFITPKGDITIKNIFGQTIGKVDLLPVNILAGTTRRIPDSLQSPDKEKEFGQIKDVVLANYYPVAVWPETFLLGPYTATLTLSLSDSGPVYVRNAYFFAFPLEALAAIFTVILVAIFIILRVKKKLPEF